MTLLLQENQVSEEGVKTKSNQSLFYSYSSLVSKCEHELVCLRITAQTRNLHKDR